MAWEHDLSRHARGYDYRWTKLREHALRRDDYLCVPCRKAGRVTEATEVDHITPKAQDGTDDMENLQSICSDCHKAKTKAETSKRARIGVDGWPVS